MNPTMNMTTFLRRTHLNFPKLDQLLAVSIIAGAIMLKVDIFTAPSRETTRSNHGTVAANATKWEKKNWIKLL